MVLATVVIVSFATAVFSPRSGDFLFYLGVYWKSVCFYSGQILEMYVVRVTVFSIQEYIQFSSFTGVANAMWCKNVIHVIVSAEESYPLASTAMFINLFAAVEPSANVCVAQGTLCNDPSVYCHKLIYCRSSIKTQNCGCKFHPRQIRSDSVEPLVATCGTLVEKHCSTVTLARLCQIQLFEI